MNLNDTLFGKITKEVTRPPSQGGAMMMRPRVLVFELMAEQQVTTSGSTTYTYYLITSPEFADLAPYIEDITIVAGLKDVSANFRFKVVGDKSYRGENWTAFAADLLAEQSAAGSPITGTAYTTRADLAGPKIRLKLGVRNSAGTAVEAGTLSIIAIVRFWT